MHSRSNSPPDAPAKPSVAGRLFLQGRANPTIDDLPLAGIVARQIGAELEIAHARRQSAESAALDVRFARERRPHRA
jgi:hypothetical protein